MGVVIRYRAGAFCELLCELGYNSWDQSRFFIKYKETENSHLVDHPCNSPQQLDPRAECRCEEYAEETDLI